MIFTNDGVSFALAALFGGAAVELLNAAVEILDLFLAREFTSVPRRPASFVPARENQMRPFLPLRLRDSQQLHARVRMIARRVATRAEGRSDFFQPAQEQRSREVASHLVRPVAAAIHDFHPGLLPLQQRKCIPGRVEELRKTSARGKE